MNNLTGHEKLKRDCVAYFRQNEIWQRIFTGFREKYSSYGRFSGKVTVKNISGDGLDTLEGFFCQNFHGKKVLRFLLKIPKSTFLQQIWDGHTGRSAGRVFWKSADWKGRGKGI